MHGRSGKLRRVLRSGGRGNIPSFPPPRNRLSAPSVGARLLTGNSNATATATATATTTTMPRNFSSVEKFSLISGKCPPPFAMIIRLTPDLVDEITRVEAQGGKARIKFDSRANNASGNVIDVGGKDFGFTWSSEMGDLCDIYEERQSGVKENGLLVASGSACRKLNVQRVLDESTANHVKMRTVEAERKLKARKAILLDHGKSSMKSQMNRLAAAEIKPKNPPFRQIKVPALKKPKFNPSQALAAGADMKQSTPPLISPQDQSIATAFQPRTTVITKNDAIVEDTISTPPITKEKIMNDENETASTTQRISRETPVGRELMDLKSMLISLLKENPKGMHLKSLVKAIEDRIPNARREIHPIMMKEIAIVKAQGKYFLKPETELESFKKPNSDKGSSHAPGDNKHHKAALEDNHADHNVSKANIVEKINAKYQEGTQWTTNLGEKLTTSKKINIQQQPLDLLGEKSVSEYNGRQAGSSSDSRSDIGKEESDEDVDVDIMTIDDAEEPMVELGVCKPGLSVQNEIDARQYGHQFAAVEINRILPNDQETEISVPPALYAKTCPPNHDGRENPSKNGFVQDHSDIFNRIPNSKSKRQPDLKHLDKELVRTKRLKTGSIPCSFRKTMISPPTTNELVSTNPKAILKKKTLVQNAEDKKTGRFSIADHAKDRPLSSILANVSTKVRQRESGRVQGIGSEGYRETQIQKENRMQPSITVPNSTNVQMTESLLGKNIGAQMWTNTYSDENASYLKYDKDEPVLKGPIKNFPQYEKYVQEYRDKYGCYCSLDKTLETERNHFWKLGKNLDAFKGKDTKKYHHLLGELKDSYHQYGMRQKRLKKVFIVLHEELKSLKERIKDYALQYTKG